MGNTIHTTGMQRQRSDPVLYEIHRDAWRCQHGEESVAGGRDFLFDFDLGTHGRADIQTRSVMDPAPLRRDGIYRFSCRFAPIRRHGKEERSVSAAEFDAWLTDLLARNGMSLLRLDSADPLRARLGHAGRIKSCEMSTVKALFVARIVDLQVASRAYQHGIGRHKAWGCGMLCIKQSQ